MIYKWRNVNPVDGVSYVCGFCNTRTSPSKGYLPEFGGGKIFICAGCSQPTFFDVYDCQFPPAIVGDVVEDITDPNIKTLYHEARICASMGTYTASVMLCRKILMNLAVNFGADKNEAFTYYVNYLDNKGYIPPQGKEWVEAIRQLGGEATHEIKMMDKDDAEVAVIFTEGLLRFNFEYPSRLKAHSQKSK